MTTKQIQRLYAIFLVFSPTSITYVNSFQVVSSTRMRHMRSSIIVVASSNRPKDTKEKRTTSKEDMSISNRDLKKQEKEPITDDLRENLIKVAAIGIFALFTFNLAAFLLMTATSVTTALGNEVVREAGNVVNNVGAAAGAVGSAALEGSKVAAPVVGKAMGAAAGAVGSAAREGLVAAPAVGKAVAVASQAMTEAASPYVEEATKQLGEAAAPYVESVTSAVDSTIVAPLKVVVDTKIVAIQDATGSVASAVTSAVDTTIVSPIKGAVDSTITSTKDATESVTNSVTNAVDATIINPIKGAVNSKIAPIKDATDSVGRVVKDALPFKAF